MLREPPQAKKAQEEEEARKASRLAKEEKELAERSRRAAVQHGLRCVHSRTSMRSAGVAAARRFKWADLNVCR